MRNYCIPRRSQMDSHALISGHTLILHKYTLRLKNPKGINEGSFSFRKVYHFSRVDCE